MPKEEYAVFNETDEIFASPETFKSKKSAVNFSNRFRGRFRKQGFYASSRGRIPIKDLKLKIIKIKNKS